MFRQLFRLKAKLALNELLRGSRRSRWRALFFFLFFLVVFGAIYSGSLALFTILEGVAFSSGLESPSPLLSREQGEILGRALTAFPVGVFLGAFPFLFFSAITIGLQVFYVSTEISLLLSLPLSIRTVFSVKFLEAFFGNSGLFYTFGLPVLAAYGTATATGNLLFYLFLFLLISFYAVIPTSLGLMGSIFLIRILPASRARDLMGVIGMCMGMVFYLGFNFLGQRMGSNPSEVIAGVKRISGVISHPLWNVPPWSWAGQAIRDFCDGRGDGAFYHLLLLGSAAAAVLGALLAVVEAFYYAGWSNIQEAAARKPRIPKRTGHKSGRNNKTVLPCLPRIVRVIAVKDFIIFTRDLRQMSLLLMPLAVMVVLSWNTQTRPHPGPWEGSRQASLMLLPAILFVLAGISLRISLSAFMDENRAFWILMQSPEHMQRILYGKFVYALLLSSLASAMGVILYCAISRLPLLDWAVGIIVSFVMAAGYCGIGIGVSACFADFNADPPRLTVNANGRLLCMLLHVAYVILGGLVAVGMWFLGRAFDLPSFWCSVIASFSFAGVSTAFIILSILWGSERLRRMEW